MFVISCMVAPSIAQVTYTRDGIRICDERIRPCVEFSNNEMKERFPDRFMTAAEFGRLHGGIPYVSEQSLSKRSASTDGLSDGDMCCESLRFFTEAPTSVLVNGHKCYVIQGIAGGSLQQYVPQAICGSNGSCLGRCLPETTVHQLVCFQFWLGFRGGWVEADHYCSCKNISFGK